jgi:hypothetical protein
MPYEQHECSSWPGLSRPSTPLAHQKSENVDTRDIGAKRSFVASPGHDGDDAREWSRREQEFSSCLALLPA